MSDAPPPPPPSAPQPPPAPPTPSPPTPSATGPGIPPPPPHTPSAPSAAPGGAVSPIAPDTAGLRKAAIALFWVTAASMVLLAIAVSNRKTVWDDFESGGDVSFSDLDAADGFVGGTVLLTVALALATTIVVSIWSLRVARHAKHAGAVAISPGLACGGWYIPFANTIVPFLQLRRAAEHFRRPTRALNTWMALAIVSLVLWLAFQASDGNGTLDVDDDVSAILSRQVGFAALLALTFLVMAFFGMRAMRQVEGVG